MCCYLSCGTVASTSKANIQKGNEQVTSRNDANLPQSGVRSKRMEGNRTKGIKISANKSAVGVRSLVMEKHVSAAKSVAMGASESSVVTKERASETNVVTKEVQAIGERKSEPSSLLQRKKPGDRDEMEMEEWIRKLSNELSTSGASGVANPLSPSDYSKLTDSSVQWRDNTDFDGDVENH
ncbi:hypothetical protein V6N13_130265 [Hibiscus sabdariffa]|uniref:Uncharacterized protein n=1 Tax=Hibiscus sabdariffa TaxID=183260 RepID=A0ABR2SNG0_9ROSI